MPPSIVRALSIVEVFHAPRVIWALSIIKDFLHLPPSLGCDPSQGYFKKNLLGSKEDYKGYISAL